MRDHHKGQRDSKLCSTINNFASAMAERAQRREWVFEDVQGQMGKKLARMMDSSRVGQQDPVNWPARPRCGCERDKI